MGRNAMELAARDPARAALMGVLGADFGADFGCEPELNTGAASFGGVAFGYDDEVEFGGDYEDAYDQGFNQGIGALEPLQGPWTYGASLPPVQPTWTDGASFAGYAFGVDPATGAPAAPAAAMPHPASPQGRAIIAQHMQKMAHRNSRALLLEPNKYSDLKVERYTFAVNATITALGTTGALSGSNSPDVNFRPQRATTNVVSPGMVTISDARVANVSFTVGGSIDAWQWNANAVGQQLDVPTLTPANKATFSGSYTGLVPSPLSGTGSYPFAFSFTGPASIVA